VPSVRVLVENAPPEARHVVIVLDAKRDQIFTARFERGGTGDWIEREPAHLDSLAAMLARSPRPVHLLGEGTPHHRAAAVAAGEGVVVADARSWTARASALAHLGRAMAQRGHFADPLQLTPLYIRLPEAEEKRLADTKNR
jgi:tRNA A37 threonylcarbamoyladenosine modification protein TsaB